MSISYLGMFNSGRFRTWGELKELRQWWKGPLVVKGIQTVADARRAIKCGCEGVSVSNHGGRQVDGAMGSLEALAAIAADDVSVPDVSRAQTAADGHCSVKKSGVTILFDSGIRTGTDMIKAGSSAECISRAVLM